MKNIARMMLEIKQKILKKSKWLYLTKIINCLPLWYKNHFFFFNFFKIRLKKKKGSFFQSITSLQKNSAKVSSKRDQLEEKSTGARNDYLLSLAAANAHQRRYFLVDLQQAMQVQT